MATRKSGIDLEIRARNMLARGLARAGRALQSFGRTVRNIGARITRGLLAMGAATIALGIQSVRAHSRQQEAMEDLLSTSRIYGDHMDGLREKYDQIANSIQDETAASNDATLASMAHARSLGIESDMLDQAAKGIIALNEVKLRGEAATRALAMAHKGDYQQLQRYIPTLRLATTEAEKAAAVNEFLARNYERARARMDTVAGQWRNLKNRIDDATKEIGRAIAGNETLTNLLRRASDAIQEFGERIRRYVDSERFERIQRAVSGIVQAMREGPESRGKVWEGIGNVLSTSLARGAEIAVDLLQRAAPKIGQVIGQMARAAWNMRGKGGRGERLAAAQQLEAEGARPGGIRQSGFRRTADEAKQMRAITEQRRKLIDARVRENRLDKARAELGEEFLRDQNELTAAQIAQRAAISGLNKELQAAADRAEALRENEEDVTNQMQKQFQLARAASGIREQISDRMRQAEAMASRTVSQRIREMRDERTEEIRHARFVRRADELRAREAAGGTLTTGEQDIVRAVDEIQQARDIQQHQADMTQRLTDASESSLMRLDTQNMTLKEIHAALLTMNTNLQNTIAERD